MSRFLNLLPFILLASVNVANANPVKFSPYTDMSLNTRVSTTSNQVEPMDLVDVSHKTGIKSFRLAFITDAGHCQPVWAGKSDYKVANEWGANLTNAMRANSIEYIVSFGGAGAGVLSKSCAEDKLIATYEKIIDIYQPNGLDFDIENNSTSVKKLMRVLQNIQIKHPNLPLSFTLPVLPSGLTETGKKIIQQAKDSNLHYIVNIMTMDYEKQDQGDMAQYAIEAANHLHEYLKTIYPNKSDAMLWQMIELTPMIGVNDVHGEQFTLDNASALREFAEQKQIHALSMWSVGRDHPCKDDTARPDCSGANLQSTSYEFSKRFN